MKLSEQELMTLYGISPLPKKPVEGIAYIPFQPNNPEIYTVHKGFEAGTIYKALDKPFCPKECGGVYL